MNQVQNTSGSKYSFVINIIENAQDENYETYFRACGVCLSMCILKCVSVQECGCVAEEPACQDFSNFLSQALDRPR